MAEEDVITNMRAKREWRNHYECIMYILANFFFRRSIH